MSLAGIPRDTFGRDYLAVRHVLEMKMRRCMFLVLLFCLCSGCGEENRVVDTKDRPRPDATQRDDLNAAMEAAMKEETSQ